MKKIKIYKSDRETSRGESPLIKNTIRKDPTENEGEALNAIYSLLRPGDAPNIETARAALERVFFDPQRYDLGRVGRYKINQRLGVGAPRSETVLTKDDFVSIIGHLIELNEGGGYTDDIDHLGNRRVRTVGELIANQFSVGLSRMARLVKERMSINTDPDKVNIDDLVNARTVSAVIQAFFGSSQLSQFMDQTNPLAEMTHKRRLSALGPGGLTRERAGFEVRDVHYSHYGRMCPIETPEGPNIGLITSLTTYSRINALGFVETPYRKVKNGKVTNEIEWLSANEEEEVRIAQANAPLDKKGNFRNQFVLCRERGDFPLLRPQDIDYMDVAPDQLVSVAAALIPFLEHDDANRALMGSNMQRQAVPLLRPDAHTDHVPGLAANRRIRRLPIQEDSAGLQRTPVPLSIHPDVILSKPPYWIHGHGQLRSHLLRLDRSDCGGDPDCPREAPWLCLGDSPSHNIRSSTGRCHRLGTRLSHSKTQDGLLRYRHHLSGGDSQGSPRRGAPSKSRIGRIGNRDLLVSSPIGELVVLRFQDPWA